MNGDEVLVYVDNNETIINTPPLIFPALVKSLGGGSIYSMRKVFIHKYNDIISMNNLLLAWKGFIKGKRNRKDVQEFQLRLMENIISLYQDLKNETYEHSKYEAFKITDPKPRNIHKAKVRDRLLHHLIYIHLYPFFDDTFISDSYSCRIDKGTHRALNKFKDYSYKVSKNHTKTCWILKCDIKRFFDSIDHIVLIEILERYIQEDKLINLFKKLINSFSVSINKGLPLGNLTSQLLVNIYMNQFDQFVKHKLKMKYYVRYADDFVFVSDNRDELEEIIPKINYFLDKRLKLKMHPNKVFIKTISSGVDFLGWVHFSDHRILRKTTRKRIFRNLEKEIPKIETINSYLGLISHGNTKKLKVKIDNISNKIKD